MAMPVAMSTGVVLNAENLIVRLRDSNGVTGWGEAASAPSMTGETWAGMLAAGEYLAPFVARQAWEDIAAVHREMDRWLPGNKSVKAAFDIALHDLVGKRTGRAVCEMLGTPVRRRIELLALLGTGSLEQDVEHSRRLFADGYRAFKLKVGIGDVDGDARRALAVREALGPGVLLCADANGAWDRVRTDGFLSKAASAKLDFLEQPVAPDAIGSLVGLQDRHGVAFGLDESLRSLDDLKDAHARGLAMGGSFKLIKAGGLRQLVDAAVAAHALGFAVNLAGKVAETGICTAALLHAAAVSPSLQWGCSPSNGYLRRDVVVPAIGADAGGVSVPSGPGLGIEVSERLLGEYARETLVIDA